MSQIVPYTGGLPEALTWGTRKELSKVEGQALVELGKQKGEALVQRQKIGLSVKLAEEAAIGVTELHQLISTLAQGDAGLEMELRATLESTTATGVGRILRDFMSW